VVAFLKRTLQQRTDQISELQARLEGLEQVHTSEGKRYEAKLASMEAEFGRAREQLVSENMVLTKKLDALEEFRIQREQLMAKYDDQEKRVEEIKNEFEERIYELEKKHIKEEDRLKKDMMAKLESVASEFRKASHAQMSATTQRTIRENVSVSAQVNQLSDKVNELSQENDTLLDKSTEQNRRIKMLEIEENKLVKRNTYR
jgi:chromosome segregation ATPase